ncbi:MerR family transcriptional regulator [Pseudidiomarina mangrovi]|uniref:MerR family transcriptional regulator n=1 Tax=Pseudidiomarina mangrovi TaxID=2487133 RepID=UPI000FCC7506|nr:MerR family transcriptional regulator [Pseudidiomarina mangrovi]
MRIGELAKSAGVSVETVRYYQRRGLLDIPECPYGENRHYSTSHRDRLSFIRRAQALGFTLSEIGTLLELSASDCSGVESVAKRKLLLVRKKLIDLAKIEAVLEQAVASCKDRKPYAGCPIIESLIDEEP